jgi:hypothetical protein
MADDARVTLTGREKGQAIETLKRGDIFLWANPYPDEDPMQQYLLLDDPANTGGRLDITPLNTGMTYPPINRVDGKDMVVFLAHAPTPEEAEAHKAKT